LFFRGCGGGSSWSGDDGTRDFERRLCGKGRIPFKGVRFLEKGYGLVPSFKESDPRASAARRTAEPRIFPDAPDTAGSAPCGGEMRSAGPSDHLGCGGRRVRRCERLESEIRSPRGFAFLSVLRVKSPAKRIVCADPSTPSDDDPSTCFARSGSALARDDGVTRNGLRRAKGSEPSGGALGV
jgi:hypothetical protein